MLHVGVDELVHFRPDPIVSDLVVLSHKGAPPEASAAPTTVERLGCQVEVWGRDWCRVTSLG